MSEVEEALAYCLERLDMEYVAATAAVIAAALEQDGIPLEVCFQPGDGTRYDLVVVPVQSLTAAPGRVAAMRHHPDVPVQWGHETALGVTREAGKAVVAWVGPNHGAYGLDLSCGGFHPGYVADLYQSGFASGAALATLFNLVGEIFTEARRG